MNPPDYAKILDFLKTGIVDSSIHNKSKFKAKCANFELKDETVRFKCVNKIIATSNQVYYIIFSVHALVEEINLDDLYANLVTISEVSTSNAKSISIENKPVKHLNYEETYKILQDKYYWPFMDKSIKQFINKCPVCTTKVSTDVLNKFDLFSLDILEPFSETLNGYKYLLVVTEFFSKWVDIIYLKDNKVITIAIAILKDIVSKYSLFKYLETNCDEIFDINLINLLKFCRLYPVNKKKTINNDRFAHQILSQKDNEYFNWTRLKDDILIKYNNEPYGVDNKSPHSRLSEAEPY